MDERRAVVQLGCAFSLIFCAFFSQCFIEPTVLSSAASNGIVSSNAGYISLMLIYLAFTSSTLIAAPVVQLIGARHSMVLGSIAYAAFNFGFLFLNTFYLYLSSILLGLGAGLLWTGQGKYLAMNCSKTSSGSNSGLLWMLYQTGLCFGGLFLLCAFYFSKNEQQVVSAFTRQLIYGVFAVISLLGSLIISLLPEVANSSEKVSPSISSTFRLLRQVNVLLLCVAFVFTGLNISLWTSIYPTAIASTQRLGDNTKTIMALNLLAQGVGEILGGGCCAWSGGILKRRWSLVATGLAFQIFAYVAIFLNLPASAALHSTTEISYIEPRADLAIICGFLLGLGDAAWTTQLYATLIDRYTTQCAQAFALLNFFQSLVCGIAFFTISHLDLHKDLLLLVLLGSVAFICFTVAETQESNRKEGEEDMARMPESDKCLAGETA